MKRYFQSLRNVRLKIRDVIERLRSDRHGAVLVEAAIALPLMVMMLLGVVTYGGWIMAAHTLQQAANEAGRAAVAGLDAAERQTIVQDTLARSSLYMGTLQSDLVRQTTSEADGYLTVTLRYDVARSKMFSASLVPLPAQTITRTAVIQLSAL